MGNDQSAAKGKPNARAFQRMPSSVQERVRQGVSYNMKILILGARKSGKSSFLRRLQALPFSTAYEPTPEITTASIDWKPPRCPEDQVKVEVWDVVDEGFRAGGAKDSALRETDVDDDAPAGLPEAEAASEEAEGAGQLPVLDASVVDVFKDAQSAILCVNPGSESSWEYATKRMDEVPADLPILVLLNFRDLKPEEGSWVTKEEAEAAIKERGRLGFACEGSMANCFGLRPIYEYLSIPFYRHKQQSLRKQIDIAQGHMDEACDELREHLSVQDFATFLLRKKRATPKPPSPGGDGGEDEGAQEINRSDPRLDRPEKPSQPASVVDDAHVPAQPREEPAAPQHEVVPAVMPPPGGGPQALRTEHATPVAQPVLDPSVAAYSSRLSVKQSLDDFLAESDDEIDDAIVIQRQHVARSLRDGAMPNHQDGPDMEGLARSLSRDSDDYLDSLPSMMIDDRASSPLALAEVDYPDDSSTAGDSTAPKVVPQLVATETPARSVDGDAAALSDAARMAIQAAMQQAEQSPAITSPPPSIKKKKKKSEKKEGKKKKKKKAEREGIVS